MATVDRAVLLDRVLKSFGPTKPDRYDRWLDLVTKRERERAARLERESKADARKIDRDLEDLVRRASDEVKGLTIALMVGCGLHRQRWTWRKKRGPMPTKDRVVAAVRQSIEEECERRGISIPPPPTPEEAEKARAEIALANSPAGIREAIGNWDQCE